MEIQRMSSVDTTRPISGFAYDVNSNRIEEDASGTDYRLKPLVNMAAFLAAQLAPLGLVFIVPTMFLFTYTLAIRNKQVVPFFQMLADYSALPPQAPYAAQMMDIFAILVVISVYNRYQLVKFYHLKLVAKKKSPEKILQLSYHFLNSISKFIGYSAAFGIVVAGNFRSTEHLLGHLAGGSLAFGSMLLYMLITILLSRQLSEHRFESKPITMILIFVGACIGAIGFVFFSYQSSLHTTWAQLADFKFRTSWTKDRPDYMAHSLAGIFQWIAINLAALFFGCIFVRSWSHSPMEVYRSRTTAVVLSQTAVV